MYYFCSNLSDLIKRLYMPSRLRTLLLSLAALFFTQPFFSQTSDADSLLEAVHARIYPSRKLTKELLKEMQKEGYADSTDWADSRTQKQLLLSAWSGMAFRSFDKGFFAQSIERIQIAKGFALEVNDDEMYRECLSLESVCLTRIGKYDEAILCLNENIEQDERNGDMEALSSDFNNMAAIYLSTGRTDEAHDFILQAIDYEERVPGSPALPVRYGIASEIDVKLGRLDEALEMIEEACRIDSLQGNGLRYGRRLSQRGDVLMASERLKEAEKAYLRADSLLREHNEPNSMSINLKQLGALYDKQGKGARALACWTEGLKLAYKTGNRHLQQQFCDKMYTFYKKADSSKALLWLERSTALKDSLNSLRTEQMMNDNSARYQTLQKETVIARQKMSIRRREMWLAIVGVAFLGMTITTILHIRIRKKEKEMADTRKEMEKLHQALEAAPTPFVIKLTDYIGSHMTSTITNQDLCNEMGMSQSSLSRHVQAETGHTVQGFIMHLRMEKAMRLLASTENSVNSIANACGFDNFSYFTRVFKQATGVTPTQYRRQLHDK